MSANRRRIRRMRQNYSHTEPIITHTRDAQTGRIIGSQIVGRIDKRGDGANFEVRTFEKPVEVNRRDRHG